MNLKMLSALTDRIINANLDAVAFVPGPNFRCLFRRDFHLMERAFMVLVPRIGPAVAVVPHLEMASFGTLDFSGSVFAWRDEDGYESAFAAAAGALKNLGPAPVIGLEAQSKRVLEQ